MRSLFVTLLLSACVFGQFSQYKSLSRMFNEMPFAENHFPGIMCTGSDDALGPFNPKVPKAKSLFQISAGAAYFNGGSNRCYELVDFETMQPGVAKKDYDYNPVAVPEIAFCYNPGEYSIQLNYYSTLNGRLYAKGWWWETNLYEMNDAAAMVSSNIEFSTLNMVMQAAVSRKIFENLVLTAGMLTNSYTEKVGGHGSGQAILQYESHFFDNIQFLAGMNYFYEDDLSMYLIVRSQASGIELKRNQNSLEGLYNYNPSRALVNFPGMIAYGAEYRPSNAWKLSAGMVHTFLNSAEVGRTDYCQPNNTFYENTEYKFSHSVCNNKLALGAFIKVIENLECSFHIATYLKYDNSAYNDLPFKPFYRYLKSSHRMLPGSPSAIAVGKPEDFYLMGIGSRINLWNFVLTVDYMYNTLKYVYEGDKTEEYTGNTIRMMLGYGL